ncbi:transcriptional regulator [Streptomyces sp. N35]|uniref:ArsR/SmtB family transcription factor n=1 Tax=Streptomyces sp. N35 TaxID=2795730 RepID=UPI0018F320E8|nr:winged helix-turn-helix domain-containing protein [Streptomyces sp. N35]
MAEPEKHPKNDPAIRDLDPRSLRGLAHPLRMQLLDFLRRFGPATASQLANRLGESSGATSYHLRQLAAHGFVEDAPEHGKGRERWWKAVHVGTRMTSELIHDPDPTVRGAVESMLHMMADQHTSELNTFLGTRYQLPEEWRDAADMSGWRLSLTPDQARELSERLMEVIESYKRDMPGERGPGERAFRVQLHAFPRTDEEDSK